MFTIPDSRLSASNGAVLASESFLVPIALRSEARTSEAAFEGLRRAFEDVKGFIPLLANTAPGVCVVGFEESISPRLSRVDVTMQGKEYRIDLTLAFRCPIPKEHDFWARIKFVTTVYDRLTEFAGAFEGRKGIKLSFEEARLNQQKDDPERMRMFRK